MISYTFEKSNLKKEEMVICKGLSSWHGHLPFELTEFGNSGSFLFLFSTSEMIGTLLDFIVHGCLLACRFWRRCCFLRASVPGAEGDLSTGHPLTNRVKSHRVWTQWAELGTGNWAFCDRHGKWWMMPKVHPWSPVRNKWRRSQRQGWKQDVGPLSVQELDASSGASLEERAGR